MKPRRLHTEDRYGDCVWIKNQFTRSLTEVMQSGVSWKLQRVNDQLDVSVDGGPHTYRVLIYCGRAVVADLRYTEGGNVEIGQLLQQNLAIVCAVHQAEIEKFCPNAVAGVLATRRGAGIWLTVKFKNGHFVEVAERDTETDEFKAQCLMLYDLPTL